MKDQSLSKCSAGSGGNKSESGADPLSLIEGLDLNQGMLCAANNRKLYEKLLVAFESNNCNTVADIRVALSSGDTERAKRMAHSLKGLAATIGATELHVAAKNTEDAIISGPLNGVLEEALDNVDKLMATLLSQIRQIFGVASCG